MTTTDLGPTPAMALDYAAARPPSRLWDTLTFRNWTRTFAWTLAAVGVCGFFYLIDRHNWIKWISQGDWTDWPGRRDADYRMFKSPSELPMRIFGLPHFIVATIFVCSSRRMRETRNKLHFAGLLLLGSAFCFGFYKMGATTNPLMIICFYFYFLIHGLRDDAFFYKAYGDQPTEAVKTHDRIMFVLQLLMLGLLFSLIWPTYIQMGDRDYRPANPVLDNFFPADWPFVVRLGSMFLPMLAIAIFALSRIARTFPDGLAGLWRVHRPILAVHGISLVIILIALVGGAWTFNIVVLGHFVGWYIFALYLIGKHPPKSPPTSWFAWMRTTRNGFMTLHLGLAAVVTVLIAISVYGFGKEGVLEAIVGSKSFYYWTVMHVTLSFLPR
ncbi:MAG TPA: hypothetical protein VJZ71_03135 [Phycisphaerae bacterium]|nr:hypothetical protein [Phycisphaerae bacterium]